MNVARASSAGHWAHINEVTCLLGIRFLFWICRVFGRWPFRVFLYPVLIWYFLTKPKARAASRKYLHQVAIKKRGDQSGSVQVLQHFSAFAESILDKLLLWSNLIKTDDVVVYGDQPILDLVGQKKGCLLICAHFGNLELCKVLSRKHSGLKITMLVHTGHATRFNRLLREIDPESQVNILQVTEMSPVTAIMLAEKVQQGECIIIAGDRIPVASNARVAVANFLDRDAPFPVGPYVLGALLKCPVYLMFSVRHKNHPEIHFEFFRESIQLPHKKRNEIFNELVAEYAARLEYHCMRTPMQWFNFYDFWHLPSTGTAHEASR